MNAAANTIAEQVTLDEPLSGEDVLPTGDAVWASAFGDNLVLRLHHEES